jgi:hypothetical protein
MFKLKLLEIKKLIYMEPELLRECAKKDASLARGRLILVLQQGLQTNALKQSARQTAISNTIYPA